MGRGGHGAVHGDELAQRLVRPGLERQGAGKRGRVRGRLLGTLYRLGAGMGSGAAWGSGAAAWGSTAVGGSGAAAVSSVAGADSGAAGAA